MNALSYFEIQSSNPEREVKFYHEVFGWKFSKVEGLPIQYFQIETAGIHGGLLERPAQTPPTIVEPMPLPVPLKLKILIQLLKRF
mgnify:CR=1 FL=1